MTIALTSLSVIVQFCAAFFALKLAWKSRRVMLLPLALAILLMAFRRAYSLYIKLAFARPIDAGAETIALGISLLMVVGLIGLSRWLKEISSQAETIKPIPDHPSESQLPRTAILLGLISILGSCATGYFAYQQSREMILERVFSSNSNLARAIATHVEVSGKSKSISENVEAVRSFWERSAMPDSHTDICILGADGKLLLNTKFPEFEGANASQTPLESWESGAPQTIGELIATREDWAGFCTLPQQERQMISFVGANHWDWMIVVHVSAADIEANVHAGAVPWAGGFAVTSLLLLPLALGSLYWAYSSSISGLTQSELRFRDLIESAPDAMVIVDPNGKITVVNSQTERLFGYPRKEILGEPIEILLPQRFHKDHPERRQHYFANPEVRPMESGVELFGSRKDGSEVPVEISLSPIETGNQLLAAATVRDITGRKRAEQQLRESQALLLDAQRIAHIGSWIWNIVTGDLQWSDEVYRIVAMDPGGDQLTIDSFRSLIHPDDRDHVEHSINQALRKEKDYDIEHRFLLPTGEIRVVQEIGEVLFDDNSQPVQMTGTVQDITDSKQAERALQSRVQQQAVVAELGCDALAGKALDALMQAAVEHVARTLGVVFCKVLERLPGGEAMLLRAGVGWREGLVGRATVSTGADSQAGYTLQSSQPVIVANLDTDARFRGPPLLNEHGVTSGVSVIIEGSNGPWGILGVHTATHRAFSTDDVSFLLSAANVLAGAIARKQAEEQREQLIAELESKNAELDLKQA